MTGFLPPRNAWFQGSTLAFVRVSMAILWLTNQGWKQPPGFRCAPGHRGVVQLHAIVVDQMGNLYRSDPIPFDVGD